MILEIYGFLSGLEGFGHRFHAITTRLKLFQKFVTFYQACRGFAVGYMQLPHSSNYFRKLSLLTRLAMSYMHLQSSCNYFRDLSIFTRLAGTGP